ncbi:ABC transporter ATP-binding protein [Streptomyces longwoodensis]
MAHPPQTGQAPPPGVLEAARITKHYPVRRTARNLASRRQDVVHAVDDVDLALRAGEVTALVGESGSGKSTVARLLAGLEPLTGGRIELRGEPVALRGHRSFRRYCADVQLILQDPFASLNPVHTVRYTLTRALRLHRGTLRGPELEEALADLLAQVHLTPADRYLDVHPHELSGGQRQRVAIARALAARPAVLLADEPVSMLDVSIRLGVLNLLRDLKERLGLAVLYITHDIASARYFAATTSVMYAGRMVEGGDSETVTQRPAHPYTRLLIASAPDPDRGGAPDPAGGERTHDGTDFEETEQEGAGEPPSLLAPPDGCRFHPRCPDAMERCRTHLPPRFELGGGHWAACWLYDGAGATPTADAGTVDEQAADARLPGRPAPVTPAQDPAEATA